MKTVLKSLIIFTAITFADMLYNSSAPGVVAIGSGLLCWLIGGVVTLFWYAVDRRKSDGSRLAGWAVVSGLVYVIGLAGGA
ncbi:hypothetical protein JL101_022970 [Skermanella rosea]|uniref:hypothetical protein n=1 Tax=Skermanella rosea TaxID=1817965 RepID=UPI0019328EEE|nr:hypothetical protein [Skermanella rosea]UEM02807.1 hypothetical protein JL101_022970 [Skermanella rosea]